MRSTKSRISAVFAAILAVAGIAVAAWAFRSVRPAELLLALRPGLEEGRVLRTAQWIWRDGARLEPVPTSRPAGEDSDVRRSFFAAERTPEPARAAVS